MIILTIKIEHSSLYGEGYAQFNFFKIYCTIQNDGGILFMKKYIIIVALLTSFLLSACTINIERDEENSEKNKQKENTHTDSNNTSSNESDTSKQSSQENTINQTEQNQPANNNSSSQQDPQIITENEAIQKVKDEFPSTRTRNDYRIDATRTDNNVYAIKFISQDAEGYPMKAAVTIDKRTGEFIDYIDDRSDEDKERHVQHAKESPLYKGSYENFRKDFSHKID
uniref:Peptidase propeptide and YPEB domain protein n=2 Tax=Staphylococcus epidermidis TaxID=1282 RepID=A0A169T0S7_STAEP|nr:peptidase propeptide and YPEB domain protein [Staphylococcus epidermidis]